MNPKEKNRNSLAFVSIILFVIVTTSALYGTAPRKGYPKGYIPFWSQQKGGYETALLNTQQIVRIVPIFGTNKRGMEEIESIDCYLSDGVKISIEEDFEEFYNRVRTAQQR